MHRHRFGTVAEGGNWPAVRIEMKPYIEALAARLIQDPLVLDTELDEALAELDCEMQRLSAELEVEHVGPGVGMRDMGAEQVYRLVVRRHRWDVFNEVWGLKVCDASSNCDFRPMWPIQGTGRLRKRQVVQVLPELFLGYAEAVARAGKDQTPAGREVQAITEALTAAGGKSGTRS